MLEIKNWHGKFNWKEFDRWMWLKYSACHTWCDGYEAYEFTDNAGYTEFCLTWL